MTNMSGYGGCGCGDRAPTTRGAMVLAGVCDGGCGCRRGGCSQPTHRYYPQQSGFLQLPPVVRHHARLERGCVCAQGCGCLRGGDPVSRSKALRRKPVAQQMHWAPGGASSMLPHTTSTPQSSVRSLLAQTKHDASWLRSSPRPSSTSVCSNRNCHSHYHRRR